MRDGRTPLEIQTTSMRAAVTVIAPAAHVGDPIEIRVV